jgi:small-conductance mechanosensitive channel
MDILQKLYESAWDILPTIGMVLVVVLVMAVARLILSRRYAGKSVSHFRLQVVMTILFFAGLLAVILVLPLNNTLKVQLLSLIGILLSAAIALSSTTFVGNAMAGMMIRVLRNFRAGDFIEVGEFYGRVTERGLFHTEIQIEDRDLITFPNLHLVTNPVRVAQASGTIVAATVSLGYDIPRAKIELALIRAARAAKLQEPFVQVTSLGDFSITYRIAGLLPEVKQIITTHSNLREQMLDALHQDGIEIVSPTFMNTRAYQPDRAFIPAQTASAPISDSEAKATPEDLLFDKADEAESLEKLRERYEAMGEDIEKTKDQIKQTDDEQQEAALKARVERIKTSRERVLKIIQEHEKEKSDE